MSDEKMFSLVSVAEGSLAEVASEIMHKCSSRLTAEGVHHNFGYTDYEEGPEPSVWLDKKTGAIITRALSGSEVYFGSTIAFGLCFERSIQTGWEVPVIKNYQEISEEWEVLA